MMQPNHEFSREKVPTDRPKGPQHIAAMYRTRERYSNFLLRQRMRFVAIFVALSASPHRGTVAKVHSSWGVPQSRRGLSLATTFRGGSQRPTEAAQYYGSLPPNSQRPDFVSSTPPPPQQQQKQQQYANDDPYLQQEVFPGDDDPYHETVQERVDVWRTQQREQAASVVNSPRDEQGRLKLLTTVGKGSRALIFFILMFRNIHLFEIADQTFSGLARLLFVTPLVMLFIGNMAGAVASFTSPSHSSKKRLKAILNLDKLLEALLIVFYLGRLTIAPSKYTPREIYVTNTLHSVFFILQCQAFTKLSWDDTAPKRIHSSFADVMDDGDSPMSPQFGMSNERLANQYGRSRR